MRAPHRPVHAAGTPPKHPKAVVEAIADIVTRKQWSVLDLIDIIRGHMQPEVVLAVYKKVTAECHARTKLNKTGNHVAGPGTALGMLAAYAKACWFALKRGSSCATPYDVQLAASNVFMDDTCRLDVKICWMKNFSRLLVAFEQRNFWGPCTKSPFEVNQAVLMTWTGLELQQQAEAAKKPAAKAAKAAAETLEAAKAF